MAKRIGITKLDATTVDIINVIRANASAEYQQLVPKIDNPKQIVQVGDVLYGYPALANQFISALVNRIALVRINSATFNNAYAELKKGFLEFGETVEEVFVGLCKAREFSAEKAEEREFKRTLPDVRSAFHTINWKVQYPITIQNQELFQAFQSAQGVEDLIARIIDQIYTSAEYDEYLLFKYLMIKGITKGKMYPVSIGTGLKSDMDTAAIAFRGMSNQLQFISDKYNADGVHTNTAKSEQFIFMDSTYNAQYDVSVLAGAFNMDKADFMGRLKLIDSWTEFDNDRFSNIMGNQIEKVTAEELALMANVKAVLVDREWFQVYDNLARMTEKEVASGMYWNYFYNVWKTVSFSPFSNAIVFVTDSANTTLPTNVTFNVTTVEKSEIATILTLSCDEKDAVYTQNVNFVQTEEATTKGVAIHKYGAVIIPDGVNDALTLKFEMGGFYYTAENTVSNGAGVGDVVTFTKGDAIC